MEAEVEKFLQDPKLEKLEFPSHLTPFQRMIAHRVAQHYSLQTAVESPNSGDQLGRVVAWRTSSSPVANPSRLADVALPEAAATGPAAESQSFRLMRRTPSAGTPSDGGSFTQAQEVDDDTMSRAAKLREEQYNRARQRIFSSSNLNAQGGSEGESDDAASAVNAPKAEPPQGQVASAPSAGPVAGGQKQPANASRAAAPRGAAAQSGGQGRPRGLRPNDSPDEPSAAAPASASQGTKGKGRGGKSGKAVFRDKDKDSQDPDFQRGRHRFEQRFDPRLGMAAQMQGAQGLYMMPTYSSEFPALGGAPLGHQQSQGGHAMHLPAMLPMGWGAPPSTQAHGAAQGYGAPYGPHYGGMPADASFGMQAQHLHGQAGMYHTPPPMPFGGIPMPLGHYGFMPHPPVGAEAAAMSLQGAFPQPPPQQQFQMMHMAPPPGGRDLHPGSRGPAAGRNLAAIVTPAPAPSSGAPLAPQQQTRQQQQQQQQRGQKQ